MKIILTSFKYFLPVCWSVCVYVCVWMLVLRASSFIPYPISPIYLFHFNLLAETRTNICSSAAFKHSNRVCSKLASFIVRSTRISTHHPLKSCEVWNNISDSLNYNLDVPVHVKVIAITNRSIRLNRWRMSSSSRLFSAALIAAVAVVV